MTAVARAFVPGHVTGFFTVDRDGDPTKAGSRGAGLALSDGVTVTVRPAEETTVALDGTEAEVQDVIDQYERLLRENRRPCRTRRQAASASGTLDRLVVRVDLAVSALGRRMGRMLTRVGRRLDGW